LVLLVAGGGLAALILAAGAADPPRAARLVRDLQAGTAIAALPTIVLDNVPTTVEVAAAIAAPATTEAWWGVTLTQAGREVLRVSIDAERFFSLTPYLPDATFFVHLRRGEQPNEIYLHVEADGTTTLRLNREVAWQGRVDGVLAGIEVSVWERPAVGSASLRYVRHYAD
jgi:hypothetical protein